MKYSVWWPGITSQLKQLIQNCGTCCKNARPRREPLLTTPLPEYPWQKIATDLFELHGVHYLLVVDYFSRYPEISKLTTTTATAVIVAMKAVFGRHGIPEIVRSDNGPQYSSTSLLCLQTPMDFSTPQVALIIHRAMARQRGWCRLPRDS